MLTETQPFREKEGKLGLANSPWEMLSKAVAQPLGIAERV
jgi:hypothetical protein